MTKKITSAIAALLCTAAQYAQEKVYTDYKFEGNANITVFALKNQQTDKFVTTDEDGKFLLKELPVSNLQSQIDDLKKQISELKLLFNAGLYQPMVAQDDFEFKVSPNPSNGEFDFEFTQIKPDTLVIYDAKGNENARIPVTSNAAKIDLQQLSPGYYIIHMVASGKLLGSKNILIK